MKCGKRILPVIICGLFFIMSGCQATTERLNAGAEMKINVEIESIPYPQAVRNYGESEWHGDEEKLRELFLSGRAEKREIRATGPAYYAESSSELLLFNDLGEEFKTGTPAELVSGFRYRGRSSEESYSIMYDSIISYGQYGKDVLRKLSADKLSFGTMEEYHKRADELMEQTGLAENFQFSMEGAFTAGALDKLSKFRGDSTPDMPLEFGPEDENYMFCYESFIDSVPISRVIIVYNSGGLFEVEAFNLAVPGPAQGDAYEPCSPRDALRAISGGYGKSDTLIGIDFDYKTLEEKTVLEGVWCLTNLREIENPEDGELYYNRVIEYVKASDQEVLTEYRSSFSEVRKDMVDSVLYS